MKQAKIRLFLPTKKDINFNGRIWARKILIDLKQMLFEILPSYVSEFWRWLPARFGRVLGIQVLIQLFIESTLHFTPQKSKERWDPLYFDEF